MGMQRRIVSVLGAMAVGGALLAAPATGQVSASGYEGEPTTGLTRNGAGSGSNGSVLHQPEGLDQLYVDARGGEGGRVVDGMPGGRGGRVLGLLTVEPGSRLELYTGVPANGGYQHTGASGYWGAGSGGSGSQANGGLGAGGGGGAADLRVGTNAGLDDRLVVAGGGGGGAPSHGTPTGQGGLGSGADGTPGLCGSNPGGGGTSTAGGAGGIGAAGGQDGTAGSANQGGSGGSSTVASGEGGGGGGAGLYGGGGGGGNALVGGGCGGGGSGYAPEGTLAQTGVSRHPSVTIYQCASAPCTPTFTDVPVDHPFFWEIEIGVEQGTTRGYDDGGFHPSASVSRQAMAAFLFNLQGLDPEDPEDYAPPATPTFADVSPSHPFYVQIEWLHEQGYAEGFADGTYRPSVAVSRQSMSAFLFRASGQQEIFTPTAEPSFSDVGPGHPFREAIEWMSTVPVATGYDDGTYRPSAPVTRQAMAAFIFRFEPFAQG
jgi:hypothetical protein